MRGNGSTVCHMPLMRAGDLVGDGIVGGAVSDGRPEVGISGRKQAKQAVIDVV